MTAPFAPPPPQPVKKKGLGPLAWVGIGCGCLLVALVVTFFVAGAFLVRTLKGFIGEVEKNPAMAAAKAIVKMNPDLEAVSVDEANGTMTVRNTKDGKVLTLSFEDIKNGKFSIKDEAGKEVTFSAEGKGDKGGLTVEGPDGKTVFGVGANAANAPSWVPRYPGATIEGNFAADTPEGKGGSFTARTSDDVGRVIDFYKRELEAAGLKVTTTRVDGADGPAGTVSGESEKRSATVMVGRDGSGTQAIVTYSDKP